MLTLNNKAVIEYILGMDEIMAIRMLDVYSLQYDFNHNEIIMRNKNNDVIGVYNLLPKRIEHLQNFIDKAL